MLLIQRFLSCVSSGRPLLSALPLTWFWSSTSVCSCVKALRSGIFLRDDCEATAKAGCEVGNVC